MSPYTGSPSRWQRLAAWLAEPAPGSVAGRRLAQARAEQARHEARAAEVRARYADQARHELCARVQDSGRCVPRNQPRPDQETPVIPDRVPDYLVELVRHSDGTYRRPA